MDQFIGEIRLCAFSFPPRGWAFCSGALLPVQQNTALFSLLGTMYGGDGRVTFALPDLRGRTPLHRNLQSYVQGVQAGSETVTLNEQQLPAHNHQFVVSTAPATSVNVSSTTNHLLAASNLYNATDPNIKGPGTVLYGTPGTLTAMSGEACGSTGGSQSHENMQPSLVLNYIISLTGIYPSRS
ncbi:phage tail protein [Ralstonia sp. 24A2]|uniref:phage tail protein n=1 Tax=Ralstonia sp. 24A2 TaxID=3447364 RepID=UPI003F69EB4B